MQKAARSKIIALCVLAAVILALLIAYFIYTRPLRPEQICPELDFSACGMVEVDYNVEDRGPGNQRVVYCRGTPEFDRLVELARDREYRKSLRNLKHMHYDSFQTHDGDFQFELLFSYADADGNMGSNFCDVKDFYGRWLYCRSKQSGYYCAAGPETWRQEVFQVFKDAEGHGEWITAE